MPTSSMLYDHAVVVDDDPVVTAVIQTQLEAHGLRVSVAHDGPSGHRLVLDTRPCLCVIDWIMPGGMDGVDLVRRLRADRSTRDIYTIMLTSRDSSEELLLAAFDAGVDDFLGKSPRIGEFRARISAALRVLGLQQELKASLDDVEALNKELVEVNGRLHELAVTDSLTGLSNRRDAMGRLEYLWKQHARHGMPLCVAMLDIDHFKKINDRYGHGVGDEVLRSVAGLLLADRRETEVVGRYGGEEFVLGLPQQTAEQAAAGLERLRRGIESSRVPSAAGDIRVTVSIGLAAACRGMTVIEDLVRAADQALYVAKRSGRNRVSVQGEGAGTIGHARPGRSGQEAPI